MIILKDKPGQLCNRLWAFSPFINAAFKSNSKIIIVGLYDYYEYFENLNKHKNVKFIKNKIISLIFRLTLEYICLIPSYILNKLNIIYDSKNSLAKIQINKKIYLINSWKNIKPNEKMNNAFIKELFKPKKNYTIKVDNIFNNNNNNLTIGVHIRRGDYKTFKNGIYYYSDNDMIKFLSQIENEFEKNINFLLCSNEKIKNKSFEQFNTFQIPNANLIEDLYALSKCDYIIGPPSTFSMWASFYGQKPLLFIKNSRQKIKKNDFSIVVAQDEFNNGVYFQH